MVTQHIHEDKLDENNPTHLGRVDGTGAGDEARDNHTLTEGDDLTRLMLVVRKKKNGRQKREAKGL
ncbi:hypothetical protein SADUNF_Sadunf07G0068400 [Salix dunnii]|uniref:Uncharacterized protein n=1 Tax=Salix dunnii TaxID=1413687 RepID=A0A835K000_9ROSI|nr:hypothetical protein SADUNF_Sadunf07G0068400 [Salix dunnii]